MHKLATQYFDLPQNHVAVIEDATKFVERAQKSPSSHQYDYIIHDVFTGGAEPAELFTLEFLRDLSSLLKDDGVIAIVSCHQYLGPLEIFNISLLELRWRLDPLSNRPRRPHHSSRLPVLPHFPRRGTEQGYREPEFHKHGVLLQEEFQHTAALP